MHIYTYVRKYIYVCVCAPINNTRIINIITCRFDKGISYECVADSSVS